MRQLKLSVFIFICLLFGQASIAEATEASTSSYIILDMGGSVQKQQIFVYNQGRLETQIQPDNSIIQYTYDTNGNLKGRNKGYSSEPYVFSPTAVSYDIYLKGVPDTVS
ncbi:hypothetical protein [Paenibacillus typhae]|uniref:hypothetical protein n=1 Tax=Paenibacillus typhae TaxID=1174501 RepID=UPI001C8E8509|nr:hypothetical protein [Paenibacillus typhae]MBY0014698.1 hypothetical protein [Paenibacillus typhae]